jgi:hypothetical protein
MELNELLKEYNALIKADKVFRLVCKKEGVLLANLKVINTIA